MNDPRGNWFYSTIDDRKIVLTDVEMNGEYNYFKIWGEQENKNKFFIVYHSNTEQEFKIIKNRIFSKRYDWLWDIESLTNGLGLPIAYWEVIYDDPEKISGRKYSVERPCGNIVVNNFVSRISSPIPYSTNIGKVLNRKIIN